MGISLEERKFRSDRLARITELRLKRREIAAKEREVTAKEIELNRSRWTNPMVIALLAAAAGLVGNIVVARVNNSNSQEVERVRAQSNLVLEAIKTGNTDTACKNLVFFAGLGLIDDSNKVISKQCGKAPVGPPSLPFSQLLPLSNRNFESLINTSGTTLHGLVIDDDSKEPILGARVSLTPSGLEELTDQNGLYDFGSRTKQLIGKTITLHVSKAGYGNEDWQGFKVTNRIIALSIEFSLTKLR